MLQPSPTDRTDWSTLKIRRGKLPHWEAEHAVYFVTFRLADALPPGVTRAYADERERVQGLAGLTEMERETKLRALFGRMVDSFLDRGLGAAYLLRPEAAAIVFDTLHVFDGARYDLFAAAVMPNHVHVAFAIYENESLPSIIHSWKSYTANEINRLLGLSGRFWRRRYYDHIVRDEADLHRVVRYIARNPVKARMGAWPFVFPQ